MSDRYVWTQGNWRCTDCDCIVYSKHGKHDAFHDRIDRLHAGWVEAPESGFDWPPVPECPFPMGAKVRIIGPGEVGVVVGMSDQREVQFADGNIATFQTLSLELVPEPECMYPSKPCANPDFCDSIRCARKRLHLTLRDEADQRETEPEPHVDPCDCEDCKTAVQSLICAECGEPVHVIAGAARHAVVPVAGPNGDRFDHAATLTPPEPPVGSGWFHGGVLWFRDRPGDHGMWNGYMDGAWQIRSWADVQPGSPAIPASIPKETA